MIVTDSILFYIKNLIKYKSKIMQAKPKDTIFQDY